MDLLKKMLEFYSPSGQESQLAQWLRDELSRRGFEALLDSVGNVIGRLGSGPSRVYLIGHMDTVTGNIPIRVEGDKLYGRGAVDAKGPLAAFIEAAEPFENSRDISLTVVGCVGEEADSHGARFLLSSEHPEQHRPDFVIIGEPSGWDAITLGYKGSLSISYRVSQERHHSGHFQSTACERAVEFYQRLKAQFGHQVPGFNSVDVHLLALNTSSDGLSEMAAMEVNIRTPLGFDYESFDQFISQLETDASVKIREATPAFKADKQNPLVRSFLAAIRVFSGRPTFKVKTGTSDMNLLGPAWGVPIVAYGPGDSALDHTPHEHVSLTEFMKSVRVLQHVLQSLGRKPQAR